MATGTLASRVAAAYDSAALQRAAYFGWVGTVRALLADGRGDPAAHNNAALWAATCEGWVDVVCVLLVDGRADPGMHGDAPLQHAARQGRDDIVRALLADGRADPTAVRRRDCLYTAWPTIRAEVRWKLRRQWLRAACGAAHNPSKQPVSPASCLL
jgi:hypothetical protein